MMKHQTYPKIQTVYERKESFMVDVDKFRQPEFGLIDRWLITEKVDGTNVRVVLQPDGFVCIKGRGANSQFNPLLIGVLKSMFPKDKVQSAFEKDDDGHFPTVILFGEGYGEKVQHGGKYREGQSFRLFDVKVNNWWLNWEDVESVSAKLEIDTVPVVQPCWHYSVLAGTASLSRMFRVCNGSEVAFQDSGKINVVPEGIVARTNPLLFTRRGDRVMWKLKYKDFC